MLPMEVSKSIAIQTRANKVVNAVILRTLEFSR